MSRFMRGENPQAEIQFNKKEGLKPSLVVGAKGIEPPCIAAPDPKSGASTNFATRPFIIQL